MVTTVTNTLFDARLAAVPAPFGPLTRSGTTTDLDAIPSLSENSRVRYEVKSTANTTKEIFISYDELGDAAVTNAILRKSFGIHGHLYDLSLWAAQFDAVINGANFDPLTAHPSSWTALLRAFVALPVLGVQIPWQTFDEVAINRDPLNAAFGLVQVGDLVTLDNTSTGMYQYALVDWGDGQIELIGGAAEANTVHDYSDAAAATYTIRLWLIGPAGIDSATDTVVIS